MKVKIAIVGGGLSGGLAALALKNEGMNSFVLIESASSFGGDHTWSFMDSDIPDSIASWMKPLVSFHWNSHQVNFPKFQRDLDLGYNTLRSKSLHKALLRSLDNNQFRLGKTPEIHKNQLRLDEEIIDFDILIDARGTGPNSLGPCGYQNFLGQDIHFDRPHGLKQPILMDATVEQKDGYRFIYTLPLDDHTLLIEDTRYSHSSFMDLNDYRDSIKCYAKKFGSTFKMEREEKAGLALPLTEQMFQHPGEFNHHITIGLKGGLFQPISGYSIPQAMLFAQLLSKSAHLKSTSLIDTLQHYKNSFKKQCRFFWTLNRMLFGAALPKERYIVFQHFYGLPIDTIMRFYRGELLTKDKVRILTGKPPVSIASAIKSLTTSHWMRPTKSQDMTL